MSYCLSNTFYHYRYIHLVKLGIGCIILNIKWCSVRFKRKFVSSHLDIHYSIFRTEISICQIHNVTHYKQQNCYYVTFMFLVYESFRTKNIPVFFTAKKLFNGDFLMILVCTSLIAQCEGRTRYRWWAIISEQRLNHSTGKQSYRKLWWIKFLKIFILCTWPALFHEHDIRSEFSMLG